MSQVLRFSRSLYREEAVEATAAAFSRLAEIEVSADGEHVAVAFGAVHPKLADRLTDEFANQVLQRTVQALRAEGGL